MSDTSPTTSPLPADDIRVGEEFNLGTYVPSRREIVEFARQWDPQPFHIDVEFAKKWSFDGLVASGLHTMAVTLKLWLEPGVFRACSLGSPGIGEVLQSVLAEIDGFDAVTLRERLGDSGDQDLAAVRDRHNPRRTVDRAVPRGPPHRRGPAPQARPRRPGPRGEVVGSPTALSACSQPRYQSRR